MTNTRNIDLEDKLREEILRGGHKSFWQRFAEEHHKDDEAIAILFDFIISGKDKLAQTTSEIIRYISDMNPTIVIPFIDRLVEKLNTDCHDAVKRCIFRMFQRTTFTEDQAGFVVDTAFKHLQDRSNAIAIRVFAMTTLYNLAQTYPELYPELDACITENLSEESTGFQNRAVKILNRTWK